MALSLIKKPIVRIISPPLFIHPARNYIASLLAQDLYEAAPKKALDAGAGKLRNYHLFPAGSYTGVGLSQSEFDQGMRNQRQFFDTLEEPVTIVANLDEDFRFLGSYDVVVCTATAVYFRDPPNTLQRLAHLIEPGGRMFFEVPAELFRPVKNSGLFRLFEEVQGIPLDSLGLPTTVPEIIAYAGLGVKVDQNDNVTEWAPGDLDKLLRMATDEMNAPTILSQSRLIYFRCYGRLSR